MSIRKHFTPDFKDLVKTLIENGFQHLDMYAKAEALIGDSHSNALINKYHKHPADKLFLNELNREDRDEFFWNLCFQLQEQHLEFNSAFAIASAGILTKITVRK